MSFKRLGIKSPLIKTLKKSSIRIPSGQRRNKCVNTEGKTCVRPVMTYASETRAETVSTKQIQKNIEIKTLKTKRQTVISEPNV